MTQSALLSGISVVDLTEDYNSYAAKLFADMGAAVTKIELPGGDPARSTPPFATDGTDPNASAFFGFLNTSKRSVVLDPTTPDDCDLLERFAGSVDVVFEDHLGAYGLTADALLEANPDLVVVSLSGFGRSGAYASYESVDIVAAAMGGMMYQTGYPHQLPTRPGMSASTWLGVGFAAIGALLALRARDDVGGQHVDVSHQEAIAASLESTQMKYLFYDEVEERNGNRHMGGHPYGEIYETKDGYICISLAGTPTEGPLGGRDMSMWEPFCELIDRPDLLEDERFNALPEDDLTGPDKRLDRADEFDAVLNEELESNWTTRELYEACQANGIAATVVATVEEIFDSEQLAVREFFADVPLPDGTTVTMPTAPFAFANASYDPTRAPRLNEHSRAALEDDATGTESDEQPIQSNGARGDRGGETEDAEHSASQDAVRPLDGVRVLDFTMAWAGPACTRILADHGADVIKVESTKHFDISRGMGPFWGQQKGDPIQGEDRSGYFQQENRNKRSITVDLRSDDGADLIREIVESGEIDVVVESFSPGVMERLGLDYESLAELHDELIMCSLSGYGQEGPESSYRAYGTVLEPHSGLSRLTGFPGDEPVRTGISFSDPLAGELGAFAILASLYGRDTNDGGGEYIDLSQREAGIILTHQALSQYDLTGAVMTRIGNRDERRRIVQGCYRCSAEDAADNTGTYVVVALRDEHDWHAFTNTVGNPTWTADSRFASQDSRIAHHDELDEHVQEAVRDRGRYELVERLQEGGVPAGVVQNTRDLVERDEALKSRRFWQRIDHPVIPNQPYPKALPDLSKTPGTLGRPAPMLGQHTREVLYDVLDVSGGRVAELEESGTLE